MKTEREREREELMKMETEKINEGRNRGLKRKIYYNPMTRFSEEQVIIAQLQGSTESSSQLFSTPCGSFNSLLIAIKASTEPFQNVSLIRKKRNKNK
jgi:hypothetical protein